MRFLFATIIAVVPLLASATPIVQSPHVTIPISKSTNLRRDDGSVDIKALRDSIAASTEYVISLLDRLIHDLTSSIVRSYVDLKRTNITLVNATRPNPTTTSAPLVQSLSPSVQALSPMVTTGFGMVRIGKSLE
jgi:hypothetical protein